MSRVPKVVTGEDASDEAPATKPTWKWVDKPIVVYVCDEGEGCEGFEKIEEVVLKDEKIGLGMRAFRTFKIHPDSVAEDPLLKEEGKGVPRMVLIDPTSGKTKVLESKKIKASSLYRAMKSISGMFYKQKLDKIVKAHLKLLNEQDKLANEEKNLNEQKSRLDEGDKAKARKIEDKLADVKERKGKVLAEKKEIWKLTPKHDHDHGPV